MQFLHLFKCISVLSGNISYSNPPSCLHVFSGFGAGSDGFGAGGTSVGAGVSEGFGASEGAAVASGLLSVLGLSGTLAGTEIVSSAGSASTDSGTAGFAITCPFIPLTVIPAFVTASIVVSFLFSLIP